MNANTPNEAVSNDEDTWWDAEIEALLERAEERFAPQAGEDGFAERYLTHVRTLIDCALEQLQYVALHNPCGDGEVVELPDGEQACAGCFSADGSERS